MLEHRKVALFAATAIAGLFAIGVNSNTAKAEDINVNTNTSVRDVTHVASGGLYAMQDANTPNVSLLQPLKPKTFTQAPPFGQQIPNGEPKTAGDFDSIQPTAHQLGAKVMVRLPDFYPNFPYNFDGMAEWKNHVTKMVTQAEKHSDDIYAYEIYNEPSGYWPDPAKRGKGANYDQVTFDQLWNETYQIIKGINPKAKIVGPSLNGWNNKWMRSFLQNAKDNNTMPDYVSWHQWSAAAYPGQVKELEAIEDSLSLKHMPISINEYAWRHELGVPGDLIHYIQNFENTTDTDSADLAFWYNYGRMDNLLTDQQKPNGGYWLYKWYGDMTGHIDTTSTYAKNGNLASLASTNNDGSETNVIFGGTNGDNSVTVTGLDSNKFANGAKVQVNETPWYGVDTAVQPKTIASGNVQVKNGTVTVPVKDMRASTGYQLLVTPADSQVTKDDIQYVQPTAKDPIRVEAEDSQVTGGTKSGADAQGSYASNGLFVTDLNGKDSSVDMTVNTLADGDYKVEIGYGNATGSNGIFNVTLNGQKQKDAVLPPTGGGWIGATPDVIGNRKVTQYGTIHLNKGANHFVLTHASGYGQLDYAQFTPVNTGTATPGSGSSSTSTTTPSTSSSSAVTSSSSSSSSSAVSTSSSSAASASSSSAAQMSTVTKPSTTTTTVKVPSSAAKKGTTIYAVKKLSLYKTPTFKATNKVVSYTKVTRKDRPKFVVVGYARSANGALRYQVRDVNRGSQTFGKKGYITAKPSYAQSTYYQSLPKSKTVTVVNKTGVNAYRSSKLNGQIRHYKANAQLKVKKVVRYKTTTRYELSDGSFITGNKDFIIQGRQ